MIWVMAYLGLTLGLAVLSLAKARRGHALAFAFVLAGLVLMAVAREHANGWVAFATWTLISYLLLNFPVASTLFLASAFCYILQLQGAGLVALQGVSNALGLLGLAAVWFGKPRWQYRGVDRPGVGGYLVIVGNAARGGSRVAEYTEERPRE